MKRFIGLIILSLLNVCAFGKPFGIDGTYEGYLYNSIKMGEHGNFLSFYNFNAFDSDEKTVLILSTNNYNTIYAYEYARPRANYKLLFPIQVDKVVLKNLVLTELLSNLSNNQLEMRLSIQSKTRDVVSLNTNLYFDTPIKEVVFEMSNVSAYILALSFATNETMLSHDISIGELEFWHQGEKYVLTNLEQARKEYIKMYIKNLRLFFNDVYGICEIKLDKWNYLMKIAGWKKAYTDYRNTGIELKKNGSIWLYDFDPKKMAVNPDNYQKVSIGMWKIDEIGRLWIKIGQRPWKVNLDPYVGKLSGTDLEAKICPLGA